MKPKSGKHKKRKFWEFRKRHKPEQTKMRHILRKKGTYLPYECRAGKPMTGQLVAEFWKWIEAGAPCDPKDPDIEEIEAMRYASQSNDPLVLGALAGHENAWIRITVAVNPMTPMFALWGDGKTSFGLAGDPNMWIRASTLIQHPLPPQEMVDSFSLSSAQGWAHTDEN